MENKNNSYVFYLLSLIALTLTACGESYDTRLTDADVSYLQQKRYEALYGSSSTATVTATATEVSTVTITETTTD